MPRAISSLTVRDATIALLLFTSPALSTAQTTEPFIRIDLPYALSLDVPRNWVVLSGSQRITLQASARSRLDLSGQQYRESDLPFAANLYDEAGRTIALMNVRFYPELDLTQRDAAAATARDVSELDAALREAMVSGMETAGMTIVAWEGTTATAVRELHAFITSYRRRSLVDESEWSVRLVRVFAGERSFTLTISHSDAYRILLEPVTSRIIASLKLEGAEGVPLMPQESPEPMEILFGEPWLPNLLVSLLATWGIGLAPPVVIRFVVVRHPLGKWAAISLVGVFWILNLLLFTALGSRSRTHSALLLVVFASFAILRKGASPASPAPDVASAHQHEPADVSV